MIGISGAVMKNRQITRTHMDGAPTLIVAAKADAAIELRDALGVRADCCGYGATLAGRRYERIVMLGPRLGDRVDQDELGRWVVCNLRTRLPPGKSDNLVIV